MDLQSEKCKKLARYIISGGTAAVVDLGLLYIFKQVFGLHYLVASIIAFIFAFFVSFTLQKYWTFAEKSKENIHGQVTLYFISTLINLGINTGLMYVFVHYGNIHYLIAQIIAAGLVAIESFFIYRWIFKTENA